jgi:hypothetical protein
MMSDPNELKAFLDGTTEAASFDHPAHIRTARALLERHDFLEAAYLYDRGIRAIAERVGAADKRSVTKTLAFLSLIAEGKQPARNALDTWYSTARLADPAAQTQFLLPDHFQP